MPMKDYRTIVVGTDGSALAEPTVGRAAWLAKHDDADLVIVCAYAQMSRRTEAKNVATLGGDTRTGQVLGREAAGLAVGRRHGDRQRRGGDGLRGPPRRRRAVHGADRHRRGASADLIVLGAIHDRILADRVLGTMATEVTKRAWCDVLIVRPEKNLGDLEVPEDASRG